MSHRVYCCYFRAPYFVGSVTSCFVSYEEQNTSTVFTSSCKALVFSILYKEPTRCNFGSIVYYSLENYSTCFGRFLRPSSGVLTTVEAATGACHGSG